MCWNSIPEMFCEKGVLKNFAVITTKHLCWSYFLIKVTGLQAIASLWILQIFKNIFFEEYRQMGQKQPFRGVLRKRCSENMQQIHRRTPMPKCDGCFWMAPFVYCRTFYLAKIIQEISCCCSLFQWFWYFVQTWREPKDLIKRKRFHIWIKRFFISRHDYS